MDAKDTEKELKKPYIEPQTFVCLIQRIQKKNTSLYLLVKINILNALESLKILFPKLWFAFEEHTFFDIFHKSKLKWRFD